MSVEWIKEPFLEEVKLLVIESQDELEGLEDGKRDSNSEFDLDLPQVYFQTTPNE